MVVAINLTNLLVGTFLLFVPAVVIARGLMPKSRLGEISLIALGLSIAVNFLLSALLTSVGILQREVLIIICVILSVLLAKLVFDDYRAQIKSQEGVVCRVKTEEEKKDSSLNKKSDGAKKKN